MYIRRNLSDAVWMDAVHVCLSVNDSETHSWGIVLGFHTGQTNRYCSGASHSLSKPGTNGIDDGTAPHSLC